MDLLGNHETRNCVGGGFSGAPAASPGGTAVRASARDVQVIVNGGSAPPLQGPLVPGSSESWLRLPLLTDQRKNGPGDRAGGSERRPATDGVAQPVPK